MKKQFIALVVLTLFALNVHAQQDPHYTQYMYNMNVMNPAYAGSKESIAIGLLYRQQWVNFPGAPRTGLLSFDMPIGQLPIAIGLNVMSDQIGFDKTLFGIMVTI